MKVESLRQLEGLLKLCRKHGVRTVKLEGMEFTLENDVPQKPRNNGSVQGGVIAPGGITDDSQIPTPHMLTPEQLMDWSVGANQVPDFVPKANG